SLFAIFYPPATSHIDTLSLHDALPIWLLHVPGHERRPARAGRTLRVDLEPQFRGPPGQRRQDPPREPRDGRGGRDRRTFRRCSRSEEHTSELQSRVDLVCRLLLEKKK